MPDGRAFGQPRSSGIERLGSKVLPPPMPAQSFPKDPKAYAPSLTHERDHSRSLTAGPERGGGTSHQEMGSAQRAAPYRPQVVTQKDPFASDAIPPTVRDPQMQAR
jgi:hypothetical protein